MMKHCPPPFQWRALCAEQPGLWCGGSGEGFPGSMSASFVLCAGLKFYRCQSSLLANPCICLEIKAFLSPLFGCWFWHLWRHVSHSWASSEEFRAPQEAWGVSPGRDPAVVHCQHPCWAVSGWVLALQQILPGAGALLGGALEIQSLLYRQGTCLSP